MVKYLLEVNMYKNSDYVLPSKDLLEKRSKDLSNENKYYSLSKLTETKNEVIKKDYDLSDYTTASEKDIRSYYEIFISLTKKKQNSNKQKRKSY